MVVNADVKRARRHYCMAECRAVVNDLREEWPRCGHKTTGALMDEAFMEGEITTCPLGLWDKLDPLTAAETNEDYRDYYRGYIRTYLLRGLRPLITGLLEGLGLDAALVYIKEALVERQGGVEIWAVMAVVNELMQEGKLKAQDRDRILREGIEALHNSAWGKPEYTYINLRCVVESGEVSALEAETIAQNLNVEEPV